MYIVIEMEDVELMSVRVFQTLHNAELLFDKICEENDLKECYLREGKEVAGTLKLAGTEAFSVQLLQVHFEDD